MPLRRSRTDLEDFRRLGVRPDETRLSVIRLAAARSSKSLAERQLQQPTPQNSVQLSRVATSAYRLLDPRQRVDAAQRAHVGRILPNVLSLAGETPFARAGVAYPSPSGAVARPSTRPPARPDLPSATGLGNSSTPGTGPSSSGQPAPAFQRSELSDQELIELLDLEGPPRYEDEVQGWAVHLSEEHFLRRDGWWDRLRRLPFRSKARWAGLIGFSLAAGAALAMLQLSGRVPISQPTVTEASDGDTHPQAPTAAAIVGQELPDPALFDPALFDPSLSEPLDVLASGSLEWSSVVPSPLPPRWTLEAADGVPAALAEGNSSSVAELHNLLALASDLVDERDLLPPAEQDLVELPDVHEILQDLDGAIASASPSAESFLADPFLSLPPRPQPRPEDRRNVDSDNADALSGADSMRQSSAEAPSEPVTELASEGVAKSGIRNAVDFQGQLSGRVLVEGEDVGVQVDYPVGARFTDSLWQALASHLVPSMEGSETLADAQSPAHMELRLEGVFELTEAGEVRVFLASVAAAKDQRVEINARPVEFAEGMRSAVLALPAGMSHLVWSVPADAEVASLVLRQAALNHPISLAMPARDGLSVATRVTVSIVPK